MTADDADLRRILDDGDLSVTVVVTVGMCGTYYRVAIENNTSAEDLYQTIGMLEKIKASLVQAAADAETREADQLAEMTTAPPPKLMS